MYFIIEKELLDQIVSENIFHSTNLDFALQSADENANAGYDVALIELHDEYRGKRQPAREEVYGVRIGDDFPFSL